MAESYLLSVIIPAYNAAKFVRRTVKSIATQKYAELIQVLVIDDGSTDDTLTVAQKLTEKYSQLTVIHKAGGVGSARNVGIDNAKGKYIAFCDADDWWEEGFVDDTLIQDLRDGSTDTFGFGFKHITTKCDWEKTFKIDDADFHYTGNSHSHYDYSFLWRNIFKASLIKDNGIRFGKSRSGEDIFFAAQCYFLSRTVRKRSKTIYCYYKNMNSAMHVGASKTFLGSFCFEQERYEWYKQYGLDMSRDCDYQRLLNARRYAVAVCKENKFFKAKSIIKDCAECGILDRYREFDPPKAIQKDVALWDHAPFLFWLKCKLVYQGKNRVSAVGYRHPLIGKMVDAVVYSHRGYTRIPEERRKKYLEDCD